MQERAERDGVTGREYRQIRAAQQEAASHIYTESHDAEVNYWRAWQWKRGYR